MNDSSTLLTIGVREIGLKSESTLSAGVVFATGITFADFQRAVMTPARTDALKIEHLTRGDIAHRRFRVEIMLLFHRERQTSVVSPFLPGIALTQKSCILMQSASQKMHF